MKLENLVHKYVSYRYGRHPKTFWDDLRNVAACFLFGHRLKFREIYNWRCERCGATGTYTYEQLLKYWLKRIKPFRGRHWPD